MQNSNKKQKECKKTFCNRQDCLYHSSKDSSTYRGIHCHYMLLTSASRGCPSGKECNKYIKATKEEQLEAQFHALDDLSWWTEFYPTSICKIFC